MADGKRRSHSREVAGHAAVVRAVLTDLEAGGRATEDAWAALALVEAWLGGADVGVAALQAAADRSFQTHVPNGEREADRALEWARTAAGNLAWFAKKDRGWQTAGAALSDAALYALASLGEPGRKGPAELTAIYDAGAAAGPGAAPKRRRSPPPADLSAFIGVAAQAKAASRAACFVPGQRGGVAALRALLAERGFVCNEHVVGFEARYGGLVAADEPGVPGEDWCFGAFACLTGGARADAGNPARVPVATGPSDQVVFLDEHGIAWISDTVGDGAPERFADDGDALVARLLGR